MTLAKHAKTTGSSGVQPNTTQVDTQAVWIASLFLIALSVGLHFALEWLFISTHPSFLSYNTWLERIKTLFFSVTFVTGLAVIAGSLIFWLALRIKPRKNQNIVLSLFPGFILTVCCLLLFDNFTYTVWKFGVSSSQGWSRAAYLLGFLIVFIFWTRDVSKLLARLKKWISSWNPVHKKIILIASLLGLAAFSLPILRMPKLPAALRTDSRTFPNIVLISSDGLNANHMSVYGYERETTPFLNSIADQLFLSTNHFPNSGNTSGAITSLLTGKYPSTTRVLYPPDVLRGEDARQNLPALLQKVGYYTAQFSVDHYADVKDLNFAEGFNEVMGERMTGGVSFWKTVNHRFPEEGKLLLMEIEERLGTRLKHIFFIETMSNPFVQITMRSQDFKDFEKVDDTLALLQSKPESVFVHLHWMGTHGSKFYPQHTTFSAGVDRSNEKPWDKDLYDDSILDLDQGLRELFAGLEEIGEADQTMVILTSDHGQGFLTKPRIPLIFWGLKPLPVENLTVNTQNLDVSPSILDYLELEKPSWMQGHSIFDPNYQSSPVIGMGTNSTRAQGDYGWALDKRRLNPPFYQFDYISLVDCDRHYNLNLEDFTWKIAAVPSYKTPCDSSLKLPPSQVREAIIRRLQADGFGFQADLIPLPITN